jgi:hypothetical protein
MVSEIDLGDSETESHVSTGAFVSSPTNSKTLKKMIATFDYNPNGNSSNRTHNNELSFHSGDIIYIHGNLRDDGFYSGELVNGKKGLVSSNYLKEISEENETNEKKVS